MIPRYTRPEIAAVWSDEARFGHWLTIEVAVAAAMAKRGDVPEEAVRVIREKARFDVDRILEIEKRTRHDVIAFLECVEENVGPEARWLHLGMTSSDLLDTALALQIRAATDILLAEGNRLAQALSEQAVRYKKKVAIGRTHGIYAEPITYGMKFALWKAEVDRGLKRLKAAADEACTGKIAGAVGTFAHLDPAIEDEVLGDLGLGSEPVASQIVHRDRHAHFMTAVALLGASLEKMATEVRSLQRSDVREMQEPFRSGQKGSSAMPHKRNPVVCERITGMARLLRGNALVAIENIALWHERDISHSSVERIILPDSTMILDYMLFRFGDVIRDIRILDDGVEKNLAEARSTYGSQAVLLALARKGFTRKDAYEMVQSRAMRALEEGGELEDILLGDKEVCAHLTDDEIRAAFDIEKHVRHVDTLLARAGVIE